MKEFQMKSLFLYEVKKIAGRKIVVVGMVGAVFLILITFCVPLLGDYYVDGRRIGSNYEQFLRDESYAKILDGRKIDDALIKEMQEAYSNVDIEAYRYSLSDVYQKEARPYSKIFHFVRQYTGLSGALVIEDITGAEDAKVRRMSFQEEHWQDSLLTEVEKEFWRKQETELDYPVTYRYVTGYETLFDACYTIGIVGLFVIASCMSGIFPQERVRKTDQLLLSSKYGRKHLFRMKFMAGIFVSLLMITILVIAALLCSFFIYGLRGHDAAFQLYYVGSSLNISMGEAVLITYMIVIVAVVFMGALVMLLSEFLDSSVGTLAVATALIVAPMVISVPEEYRFFSQLWIATPGDIVAIWNIFDVRTIVLFGKVFMIWQVVPIFYLIISIFLAILGENHFVRRQINGR